MESIFGLVCTLVALVGLLVALGHDGYLLALNSAANKRTGGEPVSRFVRGRWPAAVVASIGALIGLLVTLGAGSFAGDIIGLLIAGGSGIAAAKSLQTTRKRFLGGSGFPELPR